MEPHPLTVEEHLGGLAGALKLNEDTLALGALGHAERLPVPYHRVTHLVDVHLEGLVFIPRMRKGDEIFLLFDSPAGVEVVCIARLGIHSQRDTPDNKQVPKKYSHITYIVCFVYLSPSLSCNEPRERSRVQLILCKDNASERNASWLAHSRVQLILCKDTTKPP